MLGEYDQEHGRHHDNFLFTEDVIDGDPFSEYVILCSEINKDDSWIWKFCQKDFNFVPIWSNSQCNISAKNLKNAMTDANDWLNSYNVRKMGRENETSALYLMKTHSTKPWTRSEKLTKINDNSGVFE